MISVEWTTPEHWRDIHKIAVENIPLFSDMTFQEFVASAFSRQGWTVLHRGKVVGAIALSDYQPGLCVYLHAYIDRKYQAQWLEPGVLQKVSDFASKTLGVPKLSAFTICGHTDKLGKALKVMGFTCETGDSCIRQAYRRAGKLFDMKMYGIFTEECKFLKK